MPLDPLMLAQELIAAFANKQAIATPPSARDPDFDLRTAYAVEAEVVRLRGANGHATVGRKVGYANKALWRVLKLDTLTWAHMYDDTVHTAANNAATLSLAPMYAPKIEPEIVFKLKTSLSADAGDPAAALDAVEWLALGFEIVDSIFADWKFQPPDFVAAFGLHTALVVGAPRTVEPEMIPALVDQLPRFKVRLMRNGEIVEEGSGKNALRSPALSLAELASAVTRGPTSEPLTAGELVSTGTLTEPRAIGAGETWTATLEGLDLPDLTIRTTA